MKRTEPKKLTKLIIAKPTTFKPEILEGLKEYGIVVITSEDPESIRVLTDTDSFHKDDIIQALAKIMTDAKTPDSVKADL